MTRCAVVAALGLVALFLSGCGGDNTPTPAPSPYAECSGGCTVEATCEPYQGGSLEGIYGTPSSQCTLTSPDHIVIITDPGPPPKGVLVQCSDITNEKPLVQKLLCNVFNGDPVMTTAVHASLAKQRELKP